MQVFQKGLAVLCGVEEALAALRVATGRYRDEDLAYRRFRDYQELQDRARRLVLTDRKAWADACRRQVDIAAELDELWESGFSDLVVDTLQDGDRIVPWETVMHLTGEASLFAPLETIYLGILGRRTRIATGRYRDEDLAYRRFRDYQELQDRARRLVLTDRKAWADAVRRQVDIAEELDALWESGFADLAVDTLQDGDRIVPWETVMHLTGEASLFAPLETVYLGILARRTRIATNVHAAVTAAQGKPILYFPARFDHWAVQEGDGYAALVGGAQGVTTPAQARWRGAVATGTVPHALIAAVGGDTVAAVRLFAETCPEANLIALVDFDNDNVGTALRCARALGNRLWGVRLDTAETIDRKSGV
jgi:nicotinic acid phosphoribosyltransferase